MAAPFPDEFKKKIAAAYESGLSTQAIADAYSITRQTVAYIAKTMGVIRTRRTAPDTVNKIAEMYRIGLTSGEIAKAIGLSRTSVHNIAKKHGFGRTASEASRIYCQSPKGRQSVAAMRAVSTENRRLRGVSASEKAKRAIKREATLSHVGAGETVLAEELAERGFCIRRQIACGGYNIDVAMMPHVAVEVCFQRYGRIFKDFAARTETLHYHGWHVCYVHGDARRPLGQKLDSKVVEFLQQFFEQARSVDCDTRLFAVIGTSGVLRHSERRVAHPSSPSA